MRRDVLCTDKTGTLTVDEVILLKALDTAGRDSLDILKLAYANSVFQAYRFLCPLSGMITPTICCFDAENIAERRTGSAWCKCSPVHAPEQADPRGWKFLRPHMQPGITVSVAAGVNGIC